MRIEFIKGTNEQYSISEEGFVIRNYKRDKWGNKLYKPFVVKNHILYDKRKNTNRSPCMIVVFNKKERVLKSLVAEYFPLVKPNGRIFQIGYKDGNFRNCSYSNLFYVNHAGRKYHHDRARVYAVRNISKWYVANKLMKISVNDLPDDLYQLTKQILLNKRLLARKLNTNICLFNY